ncbi:splicing factor 3A subunit [Rhynchospora pubera]|uniref:Splicing factor 3A subunit n=1 Tax=Rhynchospora pubera TaxID=906938 RepID=A0AAV8EM01_9POAL|nr:splicing factor 3A subunit [Rhynchospora pubera]
MAGKLIGWRPWPPQPARRFQVRLVVRRVENAKLAEKLTVELRWKVQKAVLRPLRRGFKRDCTKEEELREDGGVAEWNEEFSTTAMLVPNRDRSGFNSWEISFVVYNGPRSKATILGMTTLNLADYPAAFVGDINLVLPLELPDSAFDSPPVLYISLGLHEPGLTRTSPERSIRPSTPVPLSPSSGDSNPIEKDETSVLRAGLRKMKVLRQLVPNNKSKKTRNDESSSDAGRFSPPQIVSDTEAVLASPVPLPPLSPEKDGSSVLKAGLRKVKILRGLVSSKSKKTVRADEGSDGKYPGDTDSLEIDIGSEASEGDFGDATVRKSFSYGSLTLTNFMRNDEGKSDDWVFYSERRSDVDFYPKGAEVSTSSAQEEKMVFSAKRSLLPWRKRKLSYRSLKAKGEPLLKKAFAEEGGDDIDYDRRRLTSSDESLAAMGPKDMEASGTGTPAEDPFGDDHFVVGSWESKEITSRDGHMKLSTEVFFASIDQRSERAAGESACAVLVAAVANWFQFNQHIMPVRSQLDSLIREGSLQWRTMCSDKSYLDRFPDGHFDLDTVLEAKVRPLSVIPDKSFIGFFHPEGDMEKESGFEFLHGSMSFDGIWDEIMLAAEKCELDRPMVYIVSWNDHFFVLKVERDVYYIVDTLGERLYEGCNQAYVLKFDENTTIHRVSGDDKVTAEGDASVENDTESATTQCEMVCKGKEACKEYMKSFLAAIPIRELQEDIKKGRVGSGCATLHQRLQIEFHYTEPSDEKCMGPTGGPFPEITWPAVEMSEMEDFAAWTVVLNAAPAVAVA